MGILKQINELAEKITGTNPNKKEIAKALDYIEQNYTSGGGGSGDATDVYYINYEMSFDEAADKYVATCDKTYSQLITEIEAFQQAHPNGKIKAKIKDGWVSGTEIANLDCRIEYYGIYSQNVFLEISPADGDIMVNYTYIIHDENNSIEADSGIKYLNS